MEEEQQPQNIMLDDMFFSCADWEAARDNKRESKTSDENFSDSEGSQTNYNIQKGLINKRI